jgi:LAO/AO transport system kinase
VQHSETVSLFERLRDGDRLALARAITVVENALPGSELLLQSLQQENAPRLVGITGPPGAGKSTLVNALLGAWTEQGKKVAVIAVDPSSPFHFGSLLGDRIRMSKFYTHPDVFIRSLASRGALGGLHPRIYEITDIVKEAGFDIIVIETVGVGQSEVEIAGISDCSIVTLVPEAGDIIQTMKAGLLEIADIFVVNKADRADAETLYRNLRIMAHERSNGEAETPVLKTVASNGSGIAELAAAISDSLLVAGGNQQKRAHLRLQKAWNLIREQRMAGISKPALQRALERQADAPGFNLYRFTRQIARDGLAS